MPVHPKVNLAEQVSQSEKHGNMHELEKQVPQSEKQHKCLDCGAAFSFQFKLKKHMMLHTGEKPYECPYCARRFRMLQTVTCHMMTHTGEKPYKCLYCKKRFIQGGARKVHMMTHTGEKPHMCSVCGQGFITAASLKLHTMRRHQVDKPFTCSHCPGTFGTPSALKGHMTSHSDVNIHKDGASLPKPTYDCNKSPPYEADIIECTKDVETSRQLGTVNHMSGKFSHGNKRHSGTEPRKKICTVETGYTCSYCSKEFRAAAGLRTHIMTHTGEKPHKCSHCDKGFITTGNLRLHFRTHTGEKPHTCTHCDKAFSQTTNLRLHMMNYHGAENPHKCPHCPLAFVTPTSLKVHLRDHPDKEKYDQNKVSFSKTKKDNDMGTSSEGTSCAAGNLRNTNTAHIGDDHPEPPVHANIVRDIKTEYVVHKPYKCPSCFKAFRQPSGLKGHMQACHRVEKPYQCSVCPKSFHGPSYLKVHEATHKGEKSYACPSKFEKKSALEPHTLTHIRNEPDTKPDKTSKLNKNGRDGDKTKYNQVTASSTAKDAAKRLYRCPVCNRGFSFQHNLKRHQTIHTGENPHQCQNCCKTFRLSAELKSHMVTHTGVKPYVCSDCGKGFDQRSNMIKHRQTHQKAHPTGSAPTKRLYKCSVCKRGFTFYHNLKRHERIHTGKKPHQCPHCSKTFRSSGEVKSHMLSHKGQKHHVCSHCGQGFTQISRLKIHTQTHKKATVACTLPATPKRLYRCLVCKRGFSFKYSLKRHQIIHTRKKSHQCQNSQKTFRLSADLKSQKKTHNPVKPHVCSHCGQGYTRKGNLKKHLETHHEAGKIKQALHCFSGFEKGKEIGIQETYNTSKPQVCIQPDKVTPKLHCLDGLPETKLSESSPNPPRQETQDQQIDQKLYKCSHCDAAFRYKAVMKKHTMTHTGMKPYQCSACDEDFRTSAALKRHMSIHKGERPHKCCYCSKTFRSSSTMRYHVMIHTGEKPQKCSYCGQRFIQINSLKWHLRRQHKEEEAQKYADAQLSGQYVSKNKDNLIGSKPSGKPKGWENQNPNQPILNEKLKTDGCVQGTSNQHPNSLQTMNKDIEDPHTCYICGAVSSSAYRLTLHLHTHMGKESVNSKTASAASADNYKSSTPGSPVRKQCTIDKPYSCSECAWGFHSKTNYKRHQMVHSGEKPYTCCHCLKTFRTSSTLNTHMMLHTGERPHMCSHCGKGFIQISSLKFHLRSHHNGDSSVKCLGSKKDLESCLVSQSQENNLDEEEPISEEFEVINSKVNITRYKEIANVQEKFSNTKLLNIETDSDGEAVRTGVLSASMKTSCECLVCGKVLSNRFNLAVHSRIHTGEKPYSCHVCHKNFRTYSAAIRHTRAHTKKDRLPSADPRDLTKKLPGSRKKLIRRNAPKIHAKIKSCLNCGEVLRDSADVKLHIAVHRAEDYSRCSLCVQGFELTSELENHVYICHRSFILC